MDNTQFTVLLVEDDLNDIFLVKRAFKKARLQNPLNVVTDGHLFQSITHYWGLECAKPELETAGNVSE